MKSSEVIQRYKKGERKFIKKDLRNADFSGSNLCDADFSGSDIRGVNFTEATLVGTDFSNIEAGLQENQRRLIVLFSFLASCLSGMLSTFVGINLVAFDKLISSREVTIVLAFSWFAFLILTVLSVILQPRLNREGKLRKSAVLTILLNGLILFAASAVIAIAVVFLSINNSVNYIFIFVVVLFLSQFLATILSWIECIVIILSGNYWIGYLAVISSILCSCILAKIFMQQSILLVFFLTSTSALIGDYASRGVLDEKQRWTGSRGLCLNIASWKGTNFSKSDLTNANFHGAEIKSTNFIKSTLTHSRWDEAKNLQFSRLEGSILENTLVRNLLTKSSNEFKNYEGLNFQGANLSNRDDLNELNFQRTNLNNAILDNSCLNNVDLQNADLEKASLINAQLEKANFKQAKLNNAILRKAFLKDAHLTQAQVVGTDFSRSNLTGACLQECSFESTTILDDIECEFYFLLETEDDKGKRERRPHDQSKTYDPGDFSRIYQKSIYVVEFLIRKDFSKEKLASAFANIKERYPEFDPKSIKDIKRLGGEDEDYLLTLEVSASFDKGVIERLFDEGYKAGIKSANSANKALLDEYKELFPKMININSSQASSGDNSPNTIGASDELISSLNSNELTVEKLLSLLAKEIEKEPSLDKESKNKIFDLIEDLSKETEKPALKRDKTMIDNAITMIKGKIVYLSGVSGLLGIIEKIHSFLSPDNP